MSLSKADLMTVLDQVTFPESGGEPTGLVAAGRVTKLASCDGVVSVVVSAQDLSPEAQHTLAGTIISAVRRHAQSSGAVLTQLNVDVGVAKLSASPSAAAPATAAANASSGTGAEPPRAPRVVPLTVNQPARNAAPAAGAGGPGGAAAQRAAPSLPGVRHVVAVGAGKGGVGKSTVAVNLAVGLALKGHSVGLLDGDIYGPSLPTMLGLDGLQTNVMANMLQPFLVHGVKAMTIGKLVDPEKPLIWRGPMAHGAFKQLVEQTQWGELDYLIIDLPPGTGDVSLTMAQLLKLTGAVVVCTPQQVAQDDAIRALRMFQQLEIEILGVVENMSYFIADDIPASQGGPREYDIFGRGGAEHMAQRTGVPFLGSVPITINLRRNGDDGNPSANFHGDTPLSRALNTMVTNLEGQVALASLRSGNAGPVLTIS